MKYNTAVSSSRRKSRKVQNGRLRCGKCHEWLGEWLELTESPPRTSQDVLDREPGCSARSNGIHYTLLS